MKLRGVVLNPERQEPGCCFSSKSLAGCFELKAEQKKSLLLQNFKKTAKLDKLQVSKDELFHSMSQHNAFFAYKSKGSLAVPFQSKVEELIHTTNHFYAQFQHLKTQIMRDDLRAAKYRNHIAVYYNNPREVLLEQKQPLNKPQPQQQQQQAQLTPQKSVLEESS